MISHLKRSVHVSGEHLFVYGGFFFSGSTLGLGCSNNLLIVLEEIQTRFCYSSAELRFLETGWAIKNLLVCCHCLKQAMSADVILSIWHFSIVTALNCQELKNICKCSSASAFPVWQGMISADDAWGLNIDLCRVYIPKDDPDVCDAGIESLAY